MLIETLPAAFEMDEILYELREHSAGLNCGRWDYIFSFIKKLRERPDAPSCPTAAQVTMDKAFLRAYSQLLIKTCHRRGVHAMGGMAAQIPIKDDPAANEAALAKVRADKLREVKDGHDGTWVAHPGLVPIAREIFDAHMPGAEPARQRCATTCTSTRGGSARACPTGTRTEAGLRHNVRVGVQYLEAWLRGPGCVPLYNLMEDAATAEISRAQVWQWIHHGAHARRRRARSRPSCFRERARRGDGPRPRRGRRRALRRGQLRRGARALRAPLHRADASRSSSPCPPTSARRRSRARRRRCTRARSEEHAHDAPTRTTA